MKKIIKERYGYFCHNNKPIEATVINEIETRNESKGLDDGIDDMVDPLVIVSKLPAITGNHHDATCLSLYIKDLTSLSLLTPGEEKHYGKIIKEGQEDVLRLIMDYEPYSNWLGFLKDKINLYYQTTVQRNSKREIIIYMIPKILSRLASVNPENSRLLELKTRLDKLLDEIYAARDEMVRGNLRLVIFVAKKYANRGIDLDDLIQEGNRGLIKAIMRYDYNSPNRFAAYATYWIHQFIQRVLSDEGKIIHTSVNLNDKIRKYNHFEFQLANLLGRKPTEQEIAKMGGWPAAELRNIVDAKNQSFMSLSNIIDYEGNIHESYILDQTAADPLQVLCEIDLANLFEQAINSLPRIEAEILKARFWDEESTLDKLGVIHNLTGERIRQIEKKALKNLRLRIKNRYPEILEYLPDQNNFLE